MYIHNIALAYLDREKRFRSKQMIARYDREFVLAFG